MKISKTIWALAVMIATLVIAPGEAATVSLTANDDFGASSFDTAGKWSNAAAPSAGNDYLTGDFFMRTPPDGNSYTFQGDSLTVNNTGAYPQGVLYKGTGNTGVLTIGNLILDGGIISHGNGDTDLFQLAGSIDVASDSTIYAKQGSIDISSSISGAANVTIPQTDSPQETDARFVTLLGTSSLAGNYNVAGKLRLADTGSMAFEIGSSGMNNSIVGTGIADFNGAFDFDLSGASSNVGDSWNIVTAATATYGATFNVPGFVESGGTWANGAYRFDEASGVLSVVPEPSSWMMVALGLVGVGGVFHRRIV